MLFVLPWRWSSDGQHPSVIWTNKENKSRMYEGVDCQMVQKSSTALSYPKSTIPGSHCIPLGKQTWFIVSF